MLRVGKLSIEVCRYCLSLDTQGNCMDVKNHARTLAQYDPTICDIVFLECVRMTIVYVRVVVLIDHSIIQEILAAC